MLADAGATVDREMKRIRFPRGLILEQIAKAPAQVFLHARDGTNDLDLTEDKVHLGTGGAAVKILDLETGMPRRRRSKTLYDSDGWWTGWITFTSSFGPAFPRTFPSRIRCEHVLRLSKGDRKTCDVRRQRRGGLHRMIDMAAMLAGGKQRSQAKPFISIITSFSISPLKLCTQSTRIMQDATDKAFRWPCPPRPCPAPPAP